MLLLSLVKLFITLLLLGTTTCAAAASGGSGGPSSPAKIIHNTESIDFEADEGLQPLDPAKAKLVQAFRRDVQSVYGADDHASLKAATRGSLQCDQLLATNGSAPSLSFEWKGQQLIAEQQAYYEFPQLNNRRVWIGDLVSTAAHPQAGLVTVTYNAVCDPDVFHLVLILNDDASGTRNVVKSTPCTSNDAAGDGGGGGIAKCTWFVQVATAQRDELEVQHRHRQLLTEQGAQQLDKRSSNNHTNSSSNGSTTTKAPTTSTMSRRLDDGSVIKIIHFYTPAVRAVYGDVKLKSMLAAAMVTMNQAVLNSKLPFRFVNVGIYPITNYNTNMHQQTLADLQAGLVPGVHAKRDLYKADLVQVLINDGSYCGYGSVMDQPSLSFAPYAYSTIFPECLSMFSHIHEVGHNMGANHDSINAPSGGAFPNGRGFRYCDAVGSYRTLLSYSCSASTRVPYFSSPALVYMGKPTGTTTADNASVLRATYKTVANFRLG